MQDVYVVSGARTAIGTFGGALRDQPPSSLGDTGREAGDVASRRRAG